MSRKRLSITLVATLAATVVVSSVTATGVPHVLEPQTAEARPGFRVGLTEDPDALLLGFQYGIPISRASSGFFAFEPGIDFGVVDGPIDFMIRGTFHFKYVLPLNREFAVYPLIGPALTYVDFDGGDDTEIGLDLGLGASFNAFSIEFWAGFGDIPDFALSFAFRF